MTPVLALAVPTRNRPQLLERALRSVVAAARGVGDRIEVAVSDGSDDADGAGGEGSAAVVREVLGDWPGGVHYVHHVPALPQIANINHAVSMTSAPWVIQLHDDDYLLGGAGRSLVDVLDRAGPDERLYLFGVDVVDEHDHVLRRQHFRRELCLEPAEAMHRLLSASSFVRQPAIVIHRDAYREQGLYDVAVVGPTDTDMYERLFSQYGVHCRPEVTSAYMVHSGAFTSTMWNPETIGVLMRIFDRAAARGVVPERRIRRWEADFFHQYILAGAFRHVRVRQPARARSVLTLFGLPEIRRLGWSVRWWPVRVGMSVVTRVLPARS